MSDSPKRSNSFTLILKATESPLSLHCRPAKIVVKLGRKRSNLIISLLLLSPMNKKNHLHFQRREMKWIVDTKSHWDTVFEKKTNQQMSWFQDKPSTSLNFLRKFSVPKDASIIDVGGGDSKFVDFVPVFKTITRFWTIFKTFTLWIHNFYLL